MIVKEVSLWGAIVVACLVVVATIVLERILPQVRSMAQPLVMVMPML